MRMFTTKPRHNKAPKRVLALPDLEQSKAAVKKSAGPANALQTAGARRSKRDSRSRESSALRSIASEGV